MDITYSSCTSNLHLGIEPPTRAFGKFSQTFHTHLDGWKYIYIYIFSEICDSVWHWDKCRIHRWNSDRSGVGRIGTSAFILGQLSLSVPQNVAAITGTTSVGYHLSGLVRPVGHTVFYLRSYLCWGGGGGLSGQWLGSWLGSRTDVSYGSGEAWGRAAGLPQTCVGQQPLALWQELTQSLATLYSYSPVLRWPKRTSLRSWRISLLRSYFSSLIGISLLCKINPSGEEKYG